ncbi:hypothetical protein [Herbaspirillum sp. BH-1]|uniref:hypothetical protein n=1 Tax=Herbaspirillum sp. (strain BH-1) TaxID=2058884 RepID=UPI0011AF4A02|nr:hypothetical protein [Herbaspirillum sp. BH-1]
MTYLEVLDTAVKVGLGALISGVATYWMAKLKTRDDMRRERLQRHQGLLENCAEQIEGFSHVFLRYWAAIVEIVRLREQKIEMSEKKAEELHKTKSELFNSYSDLTSAESKLLLLGHVEAQRLIREMGDLTKSIRRTAWEGNTKLTEIEMEESRKKFLAAREKLFAALSLIYRSET